MSHAVVSRVGGLSRRGCRRLVAAILICHALTSIGGAADTVEISLGANALKDPLVEYAMPPRGSPDRVEFLPAGILVRQMAEVKGRPSGGTGVKLLVNAKGDFRCEVEFECHQLDKPSAGWGQGMLIRVLTDDPQSPVMAFGCIANKRFPRCYWVQLTHGESKPADRFVRPCTFSKGSWIVERKGREVVLSVNDGSGHIHVVTKLPCTEANLNGVQLWCTRQETGNAAAEFLLKKVSFSTDSMFAYAEPPRKAWGPWTMAMVVILVNALGYAIYWGGKRLKAYRQRAAAASEI